jgi:elongation factor Ts
MTEITATLVKRLRDQTQAGMMDCKDALIEANGDFEAAIDVLRRRGIQQGDKRSGRDAKEGRIAIYISDKRELGAIVEVNCETDFVARNPCFIAVVNRCAEGLGESEDLTAFGATVGEKVTLRRTETFLNFGEGKVYSYLHSNGQIGVLLRIGTDDEEVAKNVAMHIAASAPRYVSSEDVPPELVEKERAFLLTQPDLATKPEAVRVKMVQGRLSKFYATLALQEQPFVKEPGIRVGVYLATNNAPVYEFVRYEVGEEA